MAKAKVELIGAASYHGRRAFERGKPQILTNASEIAFFKSKGDFSVVMLKDDDAPPVAVAKPSKPSKPTAKAVEVEEADEEDEEEEAEEDEESNGPPSYSRAALEKMSKDDLVAMATGFAINVGTNPSKAKLVGAILKYQIDDAKSDEDEEDED